MSNEVDKFVSAFRHHFAIFIITALSLVVALQWQETITSVINQYFPGGSGIAYKVLASTVITVVAVPVVYGLSKLKTREVQLVEVVQKK